MAKQQSDVDELIQLLRRKNEALRLAAEALDKAAARLDGCGRDLLSERFGDEANKARLASMELPCLTLRNRLNA